ncbi:uncharacterized protein LOC108737307 [Agrilus planipennis]|uniref:Uncharacterized protein LOC108737307 n=1 Tax=Agrilus planipennis TaxID=224129 RepID=A0A7F5RLX8_AGRPL|nr:uncharacterized protein LOC108737307 [Agrilus planipennis]
MEKCQNLVLEYKQQIASLEKKITKLEFQRCESSIRHHEISWKHNREQLLNEKLEQVLQRILAEIQKMRNDGTLPKTEADNLLSLIHVQFERFEETNNKTVAAITSGSQNV